MVDKYQKVQELISNIDIVSMEKYYWWIVLSRDSVWAKLTLRESWQSVYLVTFMNSFSFILIHSVSISVAELKIRDQCMKICIPLSHSNLPCWSSLNVCFNDKVNFDVYFTIRTLSGSVAGIIALIYPSTQPQHHCTFQYLIVSLE